MAGQLAGRTLLLLWPSGVDVDVVAVVVFLVADDVEAGLPAGLVTTQLVKVQTSDLEEGARGPKLTFVFSFPAIKIVDKTACHALLPNQYWYH